MDYQYKLDMLIQDRDSAAMRGDIGKKACAIRLLAARLAAGYDQQQKLARAIDIRPTAYNNMEKGLSFPTREVMRFFYRAHRIDFNFLMHGDWSQLPADVIDALFDALARAHSEWDRRERSDPPHTDGHT